MKLISQIDVSQKTVFVRADLDVPVQKSQIAIEGGTRLTNLKSTVSYLLGQGAKVIIAGHIDRPQMPDPALSTKQLLIPLQSILGRPVVFQEKLNQTTNNQLVILENLRFWPGEVANDPAFAKQLASLANIYINEAFGNCHRLHASMVTLPTLLPHAAGFHLEQEVEELTKLLSGPLRPFVAVVGGAKIETKLPLVTNLSKIADFVLVGGELPLEIKHNALAFGPNVWVAALTSDSKDIDAPSQIRFSEIIKKSKTVIWNGPLGYYEGGYTAGTLAVAAAIIQSGVYSVVGGGETLEFLAKNNLISNFSFVSSGGGAMLEFLAGKSLPAVTALS